MATYFLAQTIVGSEVGFDSSFGGSTYPPTIGGFTVELIRTGGGGGTIEMYLAGNAVSFLTGESLWVNGTEYAPSGTPSFDGTGTGAQWTDAGFAFVNGRQFSVEVGDAFQGPVIVGLASSNFSSATFNITFANSNRIAGDILVIAIETENQAIAAPSGFTQFTSYTGTPSRGTAGASSGVRMTVFTKVSVGTETTVGIPDSGAHQIAHGYALRGRAGQAIEIAAAIAGNATGTSGSFTAPANTAADALIAFNVASDRDAAAANWSGFANAALIDPVEIFDVGTSTANGGGVALFVGGKSTAGSVGNGTATHAASVGYAWITLAVQHVSSTPSVTPASAAHTHTAGIPLLAWAGSVVPASVTHAAAASSPTLSVPVAVAPDGAAHVTTASQATVAANSVTTPASAASVHAASSPTLAPQSNTSPASSAHATAASAPTLATASTVAPDGAAHTQTASSPTLALHVALTPDSSAHVTVASEPSLAPAETVQPENVAHSTAASEPSVTPRATAAPASSAHATAATAPTLATGGSLQPASAAHATTCSSPTLATVSGALTPEYVAHLTAAASASVAARSTVSPDGASHATDASSPSLASVPLIAPDNAAHATAASSPAIVSSYIPGHTESRSAPQVRRSASLGQLRASASLEQSRRTASSAQDRTSASPLQVRASRSIPQRRRT